MTKKIIAAIPARYAATRFPGKLMQMLGAMPVIAHTYLAAKNSSLFDDVMVVTDSPVIYNEITGRGGHAIMSENAHQSGADRIAEAVKNMDADVIVNVQGDEPFIKAAPLKKLVGLFENENVQVASLMRQLVYREEAQNPNMVKVVTDKVGKALYFSRSPIPFCRDAQAAVPYYLHIGVYAFTKAALIAFTSWPPSMLEQTEKLEQLRFLENGVDIYMAETDYKTVAIDTPEDLILAGAILQKKH